ncbi:MAG: putative flavoprotein involved in K+ transport [Phormidesmis priestleyi Ana]|uniref:Putative flavoprotein involved in K+ transport n=1 Tax=Phormidesmis priestleyi Ana TaxID=1666911 RepID=A0A0P8BJK6_9CYAN|nr:MAG: putative flavoprotein involved in K+ transport [Phormidesmis priestleyi Ana]
MADLYSADSSPTSLALQDFWEVPEQLPDATQRLHRLVSKLYADLEIVSYPGCCWDYSRDSNILEVAILGAGQAGKSAAFGLRQQGISRVRIFDRRPVGREGVWHDFARNALLRSPKKVTGGLDWGIANLSFRRWCEACYGEAYWQRISYIPRPLWADYLDWYGQVLDLPIQNDTDVQDISWNEAEQCFWLQAQHQGRPECYKARFIIFATGMACAGGKNIPAIVHQSLPAHAYYHTMDDINFASFAGKRVMIVGGGASAFDNALLLLKAGAKSVDISIRRSHLPNLNRIRWSEWNGYHRHYIDLPNEIKWFYSLSEFRLGQLPPAHTYHQAVKDSRFALHTNAAIKRLSYRNEEIVGEYGTSDSFKTLYHDALICGTGFVNSLNRQPELKTLSPYISRWQDHFTPPSGDEHIEMAQYPYLGKSLEFIPLTTEHSHLQRCYYLCCGSAFLSGFRANLTDLQFAVPRIIYDIGRQLFIEHQDEIKADFEAYDKWEY